MRFLQIGRAERTPDTTTIWLVRKLLTDARAIAKLFAVFDDRLKDGGC